MVRRVTYENATEKDYDEIMDLNGRSVVVATAAAIPHLKAAAKDDSGFIINTTSIAARNGASGGAGLYGSSKAFVHNVTRGMAKELIPFGIRVNAIAAGFFPHETSTAGRREGGTEVLQNMIPAGRTGSIHEFGWLSAMTCTPFLAGLTGQVILQDGGQ